MLEVIQEFVNNNPMIVLLGIVAVVIIVGFIIIRKPSSNSMATVPTPAHDLEGMDNVNMVCDLANGVCMPQQQEQMQEHQQMMEPIMEQQGGENGNH